LTSTIPELGFRETEVQHLDPAVVGHPDVAGFHLAMRDAPLMRGRQRIGERDGHLGAGVGRLDHR
jgi:hypothetical protein